MTNLRHWLRPRLTPANATPPTEHARLARSIVQATADALTRRADGDAVVQAYCDALAAASDRLLAAWTWFGEPDAPRIVPQVVAGRMARYGKELTIERSWLTDRGPAYRTLRGERLGPFNISERALYPAWRVAAGEYGIRSVLCTRIPSARPGHAGLFALYSDTPDYFDPTLTALADAVGELFGTLLTHAMDLRHLQDAAQTDALTGLYNRRALDHFAATRRRDGARASTMVVLMVDLDHFKQVNDRHGHATGDAVLRRAAQLLRGVARQADFVGRIGGEEFVLCLPDTDLRGGGEVAERLRQALGNEAHRADGGQLFRVSASIGLAVLGADEALEAGLSRADAALYEAKRGGRDRVVPTPAAAPA